MQLDARAIQILRNFSSINQSMVFKPGDTLKTVSPSRTIIAKATISSEIERTFAIFDLSRFLSAVSLFSEPTIETEEKFATISNGSEKLRYIYADLSCVMSPPEKELVLPSIDVEFDLPNEVLQKTQKALGVIGAPEIAITGEDGSIFFEALHSKNSSENNYKIKVGETDKSFRFIYLAENIKLLPGDYRVNISQKGISHFKGTDVEYWVVTEAHSSYNG